jgi:hypothetical protein
VSAIGRISNFDPRTFYKKDSKRIDIRLFGRSGFTSENLRGQIRDVISVDRTLAGTIS